MPPISPPNKVRRQAEPKRRGRESRVLNRVPARGGQFRRKTSELWVLLSEDWIPLFALCIGHSIVPHWLALLEVLGLFSVAVVDSSVIPLPLPGSTDLLLWLVTHGGDPWLLGSMAIAGSLAGGYITWYAGRGGGEAALRRYVPARRLGRIVRWVERYRILAVFLPALLPPPIPLLPFVLAYGALGVSRGRFLLVYGAARTLRYSLVAWLGAAYGRRALRLWSGTLDRWSTPLLCVFVSLLVAGLLFGTWKIRRPRKPEAAFAD